MIIKYIPNILEKKDRETFEVEYKAQNLEEYWQEICDGKSRENIVPIVSGGKKEWDFVPCKDDDVIFANDVTGGDSGGIFSGVIGAALLTAGIILSGGSLAPALAPVLMGMGISMLAGTVVGMLFTPTMPDVPDMSSGTSQSPTYSWGGIKNIVGEGNVVPLIYGKKHKMGGALIEAYIDGDAQSGRQARKYLNALFAVSEGPIHGIDVDSIRIQNRELGYYGDDIQIWSRTGEMDQSPIENFSKVVRHYEMQSQIHVKQGAENQYIYKTYNECDAARVTITSPALYQMNDQGELQEFTVDIWCEYAPIDDPENWTTPPYDMVKGKSTSAVEHDFYLEFPTKKQYLIKVYRATGDHESDPKIVCSTLLKSVAEVELATLRYPYTALYGVRIKANNKLSGSMPEFTADVSGIKIPDVRNGATTLEAAGNPANILYDLITNTRYGIARWYPDVKVDLDSLKDLADWCDEEITYKKHNPLSGMMEDAVQKRYEFNYVFDAETKAVDAVNYIANSCRAIPYWSGDVIRFVIDRPDSNYVQMFSMGNIIEDSFEETYIGNDEIPNQVEVQILDEENEFKRAQILAVDRARINEVSNPKTIKLYGITDQARAKRELVFALKKLKALRKKITFSASIDALMCEVGDLILFQHDIPQYGFGGRVIGTSGQTVSLSRRIPMEIGKQYTLRIRKSDGVFVKYTFTATATVTSDIIDVGETVDAGIAAYDLWVFGEVAKEAKPFRINSIVNSSKTQLEISATEYNESVFGDDDSIEIVDTKYSHLGLVARYEIDGSLSDPPAGDPTLIENPGRGEYEIPPLVTDVTASEKLKLLGNVYRSDIDVMFAPVEMPANSSAKIVRYEVIYSNDSGVSWTNAGTVVSHGFYRIANVEPGTTYWIHVKPYTNYDRTNSIELTSHMLDNEVLVQGKVSPPMAPSGLTAAGETFINKLQWTAPPDPDIDYYEIWSAASNNRAAAVEVGASKGAKFTHAGLNQETTYYYWIRAVDTAGNISEWHPFSDTAGVSCSPLNDPAKVLNLLTGSISEGQLTTALNTKITTAEGAASQVELLENQWTVKIQEDETIVGAGLLLYQDFDGSTSYEVDDYVWGSDNEAYKCILINPAPSVAPTDASGGTYWQLVAYGAKSEFIIKADKFAVVNPNDTAQSAVPFIVGTIDGVSTVGINGALVVDGSINGDKIYAQSEITLNTGGKLTIESDGLIEMKEGGKLTVGADNIIIDSTDDSIVVAPDGGVSGADYAKLTNGDIEFMYWNPTSSQHEIYASMRRFEHGVAENDTVVQIPGYWRNQPRVIISPFEMGTYDASHSAQDQALRINITDFQLQSGETNKWEFKPAAALTLASGSESYSGFIEDHLDVYPPSDYQTSVQTVPVGGARKLTITHMAKAYLHGTKYVAEEWRDVYGSINAQIYLHYKYGGTWYSIASGGKLFTYAGGYQQINFSTPTVGADITDWYLRFDVYGWTISPDCYNYKMYGWMNVQSWGTDLSGFTVLQPGHVNWWAIGV